MARGDQKIDHLNRMWLFTTTNKKELTRIARACDEVSVPKGRVMTEEGKPGHEFFLIMDGQASVRRGNRKVASLGPGQYFGELALLSRLPRNATIVADTDMEVLVLGQREFSALLDDIPGLAHKLLEAMATRLREADAKVG